MKNRFCFAFAVILTGTFGAFSQSTRIEPTPTPVKVVITDNMPRIQTSATPAPRISPTPIVVGGQRDRVADVDDRPDPSLDDTTNAAAKTNLSYSSMNFGQMKNRIAEAKRQMQNRPLATALTIGDPSTELVRIAFHDWKTKELDYVVLTKDAFLSTAADKLLTSQNGKFIITRTIRGNGVNTPITLRDENGNSMLPLLVQYPVIREGKFIETAYYMSTHPGLVTPEVVNAGKYYVRNVLEIARDRLREKGVVIQPKVIDIAERLAAVEHVDHLRFKTEYHPNIYNDIYTLFALNEGQTYRYSVSSAGAGGMAQMIPSTYRMVRSWNPNVPLMPDFVEGMRNHVNASQAMLIYMQRTWNDLIASPTVADAFANGLATQEQLLAAGYNSNPAKLSGYIKRGGANWTSLIPRETKIYLQIYDSIERFVPMAPRSR